MTVPRLIEIKARADNASPGPWEILTQEPQNYHKGGSYAWVLARLNPGSHEANIIKVCHQDWPPHPADAEFIAHARSDIPYLLGYIEEQRQIVNELTSRNE